MKNSKEMDDWLIGEWVNRGMKSSKLYRHSPISLFPHHRSFLKRFIFGLFIILSIESCYENRTGCLDLRATNFDIDADRECDNCCVYPQLRLAFEHKLDEDSTANLTYNTVIYQDGARNAFRVRDIQFYISNARLVREDGTEVYPTDSLNVQIQPPGGEARAQKIADNVALINRSNFAAAEMGRLVTTGKFTKIRFTVGLPGVLNQVIPTSLPDSLENHPLENTAMYVNADTGFIFNRLQLFNSTEQTDTTFTTFRVIQPNLAVVELPLENATVIEGYHVRVIVRINYLEWFRNVDLKNEDSATVATKITKNLPNAFSNARVTLE